MSRLKIFDVDPLRAAHLDTRDTHGTKTVVRVGVTAFLLALATLGGCASGPAPIPPPRPIIIHSGARLRVDHERMKEINEWVVREDENIRMDPSFWVIGSPVPDEVFPWENLRISNDSVTVRVPRNGQDAAAVYQIYGHLHLMVSMGRQEEWLPEAPDAVGYELERAIVKRVSDAWILGRTTFDFVPFGPLDELAYSVEEGFIDAFIFTARPQEFATSRTSWARRNPGEMERYREWFVQTFNREPPGLRSN